MVSQGSQMQKTWTIWDKSKCWKLFHTSKRWQHAINAVKIFQKWVKMLPAIVRPMEVISPFSSIASMRYNCFKASCKDSAATKTTRFVIIFLINEKKECEIIIIINAYRKGDQENQIWECQDQRGSMISNKERFQQENISVFQELLRQGTHHYKRQKGIICSTFQAAFFQLSLHVD